MNHTKWFLFARIEDHIPRCNTVKEFFDAATIVLGTPIKNASDLVFACHMHRLHGEWVLLLYEMVSSAPRHIIDQLPQTYKHTSPPGVGTYVHLLYRFATAIEYRAKDVWDKSGKRDINRIFGGMIPPLLDRHMQFLICGNIGEHGKPNRSAMIAFMHGCKKRGIDAGLRRAMCYVLHGLFIDYIITFNLICGIGEDSLRKNASVFLKERPTKRTMQTQTDSIAHAATLKCIHNGYDNYNYASVIFSNVYKVRKCESYVLYWVYCRAVGIPIQKLSEEKADMIFDIDKIYTYLHKWMFCEALDMRLFELNAQRNCTPLSIRFAYCDLIEAYGNDIRASVQKHIPKSHEAYKIYMEWAEYDEVNMPSSYEIILNRK